MCGRFTLAIQLPLLEERFSVQIDARRYTPRYNIAPTQAVLTVVDDGGRRAEYQRWGLIPFWAKDPAIGSHAINARAETVADKPSFREPFRKQRCLVLADGFYEWRHGTPMRIVLQSGEPFAFAGLWDAWRAPSGEVIHTCSIITTVPNELIAPIHDRMPVILPVTAETQWLDQQADRRRLIELLKPYPAAMMVAYPVSTVVNSPRNDTVDCVTPLA